MILITVLYSLLTVDYADVSYLSTYRMLLFPFIYVTKKSAYLT